MGLEEYISGRALVLGKTAPGGAGFGAGERGPDQVSDSLPRAGKHRFPHPRPIPRAAAQ